MDTTYAYLIGVCGLGVVFTVLLFLRKDLRQIMLYSGFLYLVYGFIIFLAIKLLANNPAQSINPGYWTPHTLLNISSRTGGYAIEDALFSFFAGGIAACLYELLLRLKVTKKPSKKLHKGHALVLALIISSAVFAFTNLNAIYYFIFLQSIGAVLIVRQRLDLVRNALVGGVFFMILYGSLFLFFNNLFPAFIDNYYHLLGTSHKFVLGVPLEEFLYALTLGMMWAPIYEYEFRVRDRKSKQRMLLPRRLFAVAAATKR